MVDKINSHALVKFEVDQKLRKDWKDWKNTYKG